MAIDRTTLVAAGALLLASCCGEPRPSATRERETKWDYQVVTPTATEQQDLEKFLAERGAEGWELVQVIQGPANLPSTAGRYFWQRNTPGSAHNEIYPPPQPAAVPIPPPASPQTDEADDSKGPGDEGRLYATVDELLYRANPTGSSKRQASPTAFDTPKYGTPGSTWVFKRPAK